MEISHTCESNNVRGQFLVTLETKFHCFFLIESKLDCSRIMFITENVLCRIWYAAPRPVGETRRNVELTVKVLFDIHVWTITISVC